MFVNRGGLFLLQNNRTFNGIKILIICLKDKNKIIIKKKHMSMTSDWNYHNMQLLLLIEDQYSGADA